MRSWASHPKTASRYAHDQTVFLPPAAWGSTRTASSRRKASATGTPLGAGGSGTEKTIPNGFSCCRTAGVGLTIPSARSGTPCVSRTRNCTPRSFGLAGRASPTPRGTVQYRHRRERHRRAARAPRAKPGMDRSPTSARWLPAWSGLTRRCKPRTATPASPGRPRTCRGY